MDCKLCGKLNLTFAQWYTEDCHDGPNGHQCEDSEGNTIPPIYTIDDMPDDPEEYYNDRAERMP